MSSGTSRRLFVVVVAFLAFIAYLCMRDTVRVKCELSRKDVKQIVSRAEEWSTPKLFRHIDAEAGRDGTVLASVREPGEHWSVTVFSNSPSGWQKMGWYLLGADYSRIK